MEDNALELVKQLPGADAHDFLAGAESAHAQLKDIVHTLTREITQSRARDKTRAVQSLQTIHTAQTTLAKTLATRMGFGALQMEEILTTA
jgi:phage shock protein A